MACHRLTVWLGVVALSLAFVMSTHAAVYQATEVSQTVESIQVGQYLPESADYAFEYGDDEAVSFTLPWQFSFYGTSYNQIVADIDGAVWFNPSDPQNLPTAFNLANTGPVISVWNADLRGYLRGGVFVRRQTNPDQVVIEWQVAESPFPEDENASRIQLVLEPNGHMTVHYVAMHSQLQIDAGSGVSQGTGVDHLSLTDDFGAVHTLAGRSFRVEPFVSQVTEFTIDPMTNPTAANVTLTGDKLSDQTVTATVNTSAALGTQTYPDATSWQLPVSNLVEGNNLITITATNAAGATDTKVATLYYESGQLVYTLDTPPTLINTVQAQFSGSIEAGATVTGINTTTSQPAVITYPSPGRWVAQINALTDGAHNIQLTLADPYGNSKTETLALQVDTTSPTLSVDPVPNPISGNSVQLTGSVEAGASIAVVASAPITVSPVIYPTTDSWEVTLQQIPDGTNQVSVTAEDAAGNRTTETVDLITNVDTDGDGIPDSEDLDIDGDGIPNTWEEANSMDPMDVTDGVQDFDDDRLNNRLEYQMGFDPWMADTDQDGQDDMSEFWGVMTPIVNNND